ncbi:MAG: CDP-glycerol glycerophosphotransferase family protein [Clostridium sp.]
MNQNKKKLVKLIRKNCKKIYMKILSKLKVKKKRIIFESFLGRSVAGNPKYIYEYLVEKSLDSEYELVWILNDLEQEIQGNHRKIKRKSIQYYYYLATAKYWIFNCREPESVFKNDETIYVQTWHGTPLKKLGLDMEKVNMANQTNIEDYKEKFKKSSGRWDYLVSQNDYSSEIFKRAFSFDKEILDYGYPANDILYKKNTKNEINKLKEKFKIPKDKKVILYAPTWRDDSFYKKGHYKMKMELELEKMQEALGEEYIILLRMHYLITNTIQIEEFEGFAYDFSERYDIQELYLVSDILITDYSSVMFDFGNLKRNMIFYTYDIESYRDSLRGFYFDLEEEAPGPVVKTTEEVIASIKNMRIERFEYKEQRIKFYEKFCHIDGGEATQKLVEKIF